MKLVAATLLLLFAGTATVLVLDPFGADAETDGGGGTYVVGRMDLTISLTERGTLKTKNSTQIRSRASAKIEWLVEEGKKVAEGDVLVELDKKDTENQVDQFANQITQLEAELKSATTEEIIQRDQNKTDVEKAELALTVAEVELRKLNEADIPAEERKLKLAIEEAQVGLKDAREKLEAYLELQKEDFATPHEVEKARLDLKRAENTLQTAQMEWDNYQEYQKPLEIRKKEAALEEARRGLERAKKRAEAQLAAKQAQVQQKKVSLQRIKQQHEKLTKQLEEMTLKAPTAGTVLYGDPDNPWMAENVKVGGQVWQNMVLITLPDPSEMAVVVEVHEADIDRVKKGMKAFVTSETQKDQVYEGEVVKIDAVANAGRRSWGGDDVKRFKVEIELVGTDLDLKTGTSARVEIRIGALEDVIAVPIQAVWSKEGKHYCYLAGGARPRRVEVETGKANDSFVVIESGLSEGDEVLLYDPEIVARATTDDEGEEDAEPSKP